MDWTFFIMMIMVPVFVLFLAYRMNEYKKSLAPGGKDWRKLKEKAKRHEKLLEFDEAAEIYRILKIDDELIRIRKLKAEQGAVKVDQTVVHGDYVDDRDTIVKDSVINKSNIGTDGDDKFAKLKKLTEMKKEGLISDDEYEKMKQEIIG